MRKSLEQLIEISTDVRFFLNVASFVLYSYEDGGYTEFHVNQVKDVAAMVQVANGLHLSLYHNDTFIVVRLYEDYNE